MCDEHLNWKLGGNDVFVLCGGGCCSYISVILGEKDLLCGF